MKRSSLVAVLIMFVLAAFLPRIVFGNTTRIVTAPEPIGFEDKQAIIEIVNKYVIYNYNYESSSTLNDLGKVGILMTKNYQDYFIGNLQETSHIIQDSKVSSELLEYSILDITRLPDNSAKANFIFDVKIATGFNNITAQYEGSVILIKQENQWLINDVLEEKIKKYKS